MKPPSLPPPPPPLRRRLLSGSTLARLERLRLRRVSGATRSRREGDSRSPGRGGFAEFVDHRAYEPGDDLRRIDWPLYARHDRLYVKEFGREVEPEEWIVADTSASMAVPEEKALAARRLVFALAFVALRDSRTVRIVPLGSLSSSIAFVKPRPLTSSTSIAEAERIAAELPFELPGAGPSADGTRELRRLRERLSGKAGVTLVSDLFFDGEALVRELRALRTDGHDVSLLQVVSGADVELSVLGRARLRSVETADGPPLDLAIGRGSVERFAAIAAAFVDGWRRVSRAHGFRHVLLRSDAGLDEILFRGLRRARVFVGAGTAGRSPA
jgi:uncharacterized protein (DUF58 family)